MNGKQFILGSEISPNVKAILPSMYDEISFNANDIDIKVTRHVNGIYELDIGTGNQDITNYMINEFNSYFDYFDRMGLIENVSITGVQENINDGKGSSRFSTMSPHLANILTLLINISGVTNTAKNFYRVADYFRFMRYENGGQHYPHYDSDYKFTIDNNFITRYSMVLYHNYCYSGELFFCNDSRETTTSDWDRQATDNEIYLSIKPAPLKLVLFPHTLCHGVKKFEGDKRDIIRGDLIFTNYGY